MSLRRPNSPGPCARYRRYETGAPAGGISASEPVTHQLRRRENRSRKHAQRHGSGVTAYSAILM
jgi:hypothetical protein